MKILRYATISIFCISIIIFMVATIEEYINKDPDKPQIESDREVLEISCNYTYDQLLEGLKATDETDGDLTNEIVVGSISRFINRGEANVTYVVFDSSNLSASMTRKIRFIDYHAPRFEASKPLVFTEKSSNQNKILELLKGNDILDGDITKSLAVGTSNVNYSLAGEYSCSFEITNSYGDSTIIKLPVHIISTENKISIGLVSGIKYISVGEEINPSQWITEVQTSTGKSIATKNVKISSNIDINTPGIYEVHYTVTSGDEIGETWITVIVE